MRGLIIALLCVAVVAACASAGREGGNPSVATGSVVHFDPAPVAGADGNVYFQDGRVVSYGAIDRRNRPYCELGTRAEPGVELPRTWTVTRFRLQKMRTGRTRVFSMSFPYGEIDIVDFRNFMWLESEAGEGWLVCSREDEEWYYGYIPAGRFVDIIGGGFEITGPGGQADTGDRR